MAADTANFVGSKGGSGVAQWLINQMPPHSVYVEPFFGKGTVFFQKRPALWNIGIEINPATLCAGVHSFAGSHKADFAMIWGDALTILPALKTEPDWLIYADPPYLGSTRSCQRDYYENEFRTGEAHAKLLSVLSRLQCMVMISGYWSEMYVECLNNRLGWRSTSFDTVDRRGKPKREFCWLNFPPPAFLHDARFAGKDFTDRQRIKRKAARWVNKFRAMGPGERKAVLEALQSCLADPAKPKRTGGPGQSESTGGAARPKETDSACKASPALL
jgi:hypothetical protein